MATEAHSLNPSGDDRQAFREFFESQMADVQKEFILSAHNGQIRAANSMAHYLEMHEEGANFAFFNLPPFPDSAYWKRTDGTSEMPDTVLYVPRPDSGKRVPALLLKRDSFFDGSDGSNSPYSFFTKALAVNLVFASALIESIDETIHTTSQILLWDFYTMFM